MGTILRATRNNLNKHLAYLMILFCFSNSISQTETQDDCLDFIANSMNIESEIRYKFNLPSKRNKKFKNLCFSFSGNDFCVESTRSIKTIKQTEHLKFYDSLFLVPWIDVDFYLEDIGEINDSIYIKIDTFYLKTVDKIKNEQKNLHATYYSWKKNILYIYIEHTSQSSKKIKITNSKIIENEKHAKEIISGLIDFNINGSALWYFQNIGMFFSILKKSEYNH